jgi:hypothetical protein
MSEKSLVKTMKNLGNKKGSANLILTNEKSASNTSYGKEKKFLLDYVFKNSSDQKKTNFKFFPSDKILENKSNKDGTLSGTLPGGKKIANMGASTLSKISSLANLVEASTPVHNNEDKSLNYLYNSYSTKNKINYTADRLVNINDNSINNINLTSNTPTNAGIPNIKKMLNQKSSNFNYQFLELAKQIKEKKDEPPSTKLSGTTSSSSKSNTNKFYQSTSGARKLSDIVSPIESTSSLNLNYNNLGLTLKNRQNMKELKEMNISSNNNESQNLGINTSSSVNQNLLNYNNNVDLPISQIKNIVLQSSISNFNKTFSKKDLLLKECKDCTNKDNINFYEVNIGKYVNFNKESGSFVDIHNFNSNSLANLNNVSDSDSLTHLVKSEKKKINPIKKISLKETSNSDAPTIRSTLTKNSLKNSFSNLINTNSIESPEELHFASVLFYINNKKVSMKFDKESPRDKLKKRADKLESLKNVKILDEEIDLC